MTYVILLAVILALAVTVDSNRKIRNMNAAEQLEIANLNAKVDAVVKAHQEDKTALATALTNLATANATIADLTAKLAAAGDGSDVVAAVQGVEAKLDADLPPPVEAPAPESPAPDAPAAS